MQTPYLSSLGFVAVAGLVFLFVVHPLWSILDCAVTQEYSKGKKIVWILVMLFTSFLGSICYGIFSTNSRALRTATFGSIAVVVISLTTLIRSGLATKPTSGYKTAKTSVVKKAGKLKPKAKSAHG